LAQILVSHIYDVQLPRNIDYININILSVLIHEQFQSS